MRRLVWIGGVIVVLAGFALLLSHDSVASGPAGPADTCKRAPAFLNRYTSVSKPAFDTSRRDKPGLVLFDAAKPEAEPMQLDSWKRFGSLGPVALDETGALYTSTVPVINTLSSDKKDHLTILKLNPASGQLDTWMSLQGPPATGQNYYGITSIAYDCVNHLLYVAVIAGSSQNEEKGFIAAVDTKNKKERFRYKGIDALAVGIFGGGKGRHLYIGSARSAKVMAVGLDGPGKPFGEAREVLRFDEFNRTRARKLAFTDQSLTIETTQFYYNLIASTEFDQRQLSYRYDAPKDSFTPANNSVSAPSR